MAFSLALLTWGGSEVAVVGEAIFALLVLCFLVCCASGAAAYLHLLAGSLLVLLRRRARGKGGCLPWIPLLNLHLLFVCRREEGWRRILLGVAGLYLLAALIVLPAAWISWTILSKWLQ
jgi:hypothetical protein